MCPELCEISEELKVLVHHLQILRFQVSLNLVLFATISARFSKQPDPNGAKSKFSCMVTHFINLRHRCNKTTSRSIWSDNFDSLKIFYFSKFGCTNRGNEAFRPRCFLRAPRHLRSCGQTWLKWVSGNSETRIASEDWRYPNNYNVRFIPISANFSPSVREIEENYSTPSFLL